MKKKGKRNSPEQIVKKPRETEVIEQKAEHHVGVLLECGFV